jgi:hypothetical protein
MNPKKNKVVMENPRPTTARKIKQFLGHTGYYRKFIERYSKIAFPLLKILRRKRIFSWGKEQMECYIIARKNRPRQNLRLCSRML